MIIQFPVKKVVLSNNGKKEINEPNLAEILEKRFGSVKADVEKRVNMYL